MECSLFVVLKLLHGWSPNISGRFNNGYAYSAGPDVTGAFSASEATVQHGFGPNFYNLTKIEISASRSSAAYGKSSGVQPPAISALVLIKT
jgi:hypothetical protein